MYPIPVPSHNDYLSITNKLLFPMLRRWPLLIYAASWTTLLTLTVAVVSFSPEMAFVSAISRACQTHDAIRVPLDMPGQIICLPANRFTKSNIDLIVPPVFAALVVAGSAFLVRAAALWEYDAHFNSDA
ncbi:forkhead box protein G [Parasponia andersonii]|uniref:Forkhead box protein G n=1 Tax=Parasponia andersonii TaxID=3476 RepID=A0A2P5D5M8_PARAD|nr:forkhead box protein G [Parasponia andersonii]